MTLHDDDPGESQKHPQESRPDYRVRRYVDPMARDHEGRKGITVEACLIGFVLITVWVNAGIIVWRELLG